MISAGSERQISNTNAAEMPSLTKGPFGTIAIHSSPLLISVTIHTVHWVSRGCHLTEGMLMQSYLRSYIIMLEWIYHKSLSFRMKEKRVYSLGSIPQRMSGDFSELITPN